MTCNLLSSPQNTVALYATPTSVPTILVGPAAGFEERSVEPGHLTFAFLPEPTLAAEWAKWFDVKWLHAARLTTKRAEIPDLVLPEGTEEAARKWAAYQQLCRNRGLEEGEEEEGVEINVDPVTGDVSAKKSDGTAVKTVSTQSSLPRLSPVYRKLTKLFEMGHLVSVDKATRLRPLEVPVKPKWFGLETLTQIGSIKRQVSYRISALTEKELKDLENRRKKNSELLELFSFSLADGQRWMPSSAEQLFRRENDRINAEAKGKLAGLIAGNLDAFMANRRERVVKDANSMYRDLFPEKSLSETAIDEMMDDLKTRFEQALTGTFLPQLSFTQVSLPQPQDATWKSHLGSALHLLFSVARYPRKAAKNGVYFARGMSAKPAEILKAMNPLNDPFVEAFEQGNAEALAEAELEEIDTIERGEDTPEDKCGLLFQLLGHKVAGPQTEKRESQQQAMFFNL